MKASPNETTPKENTQPVHSGTIEDAAKLPVGTKTSQLVLTNEEDMVPVVAFKERRSLRTLTGLEEIQTHQRAGEVPDLCVLGQTGCCSDPFDTCVSLCRGHLRACREMVIPLVRSRDFSDTGGAAAQPCCSALVPLTCMFIFLPCCAFIIV